jgi:hypothetical protein
VYFIATPHFTQSWLHIEHIFPLFSNKKIQADTAPSHQAEKYTFSPPLIVIPVLPEALS